MAYCVRKEWFGRGLGHMRGGISWCRINIWHFWFYDPQFQLVQKIKKPKSQYWKTNFFWRTTITVSDASVHEIPDVGGLRYSGITWQIGWISRLTMLEIERIQNIHINIHGKRTTRTNALNADVSISREFRLFDDNNNNNNIEKTVVWSSWFFGWF